MLTRREAIVGGMAAAVPMIGGASPVKSMIGAFSTGTIPAYGDSVVNPYVTDGMFGMWDGIWNAGLGVHDSTTMVWKDLIGVNDIALSGEGVWLDDAKGVGLGGQSEYIGGDIAIRSLFKVCLSPTWEVVMRNLQRSNYYQHSSRCGFAFRCPRYYYSSAGNGINLRVSTAPEQPLLGGGVTTSNISCCEPPDISNMTATFVGIAGTSMYGVADGYWYVNGVEYEDTSLTPYNGGWADSARPQNRVYVSDSVEICCCRVYDRQLTAAEVAHNHAVDKERFGI